MNQISELKMVLVTNDTNHSRSQKTQEYVAHVFLGYRTPNGVFVSVDELESALNYRLDGTMTGTDAPEGVTGCNTVAWQSNWDMTIHPAAHPAYGEVLVASTASDDVGTIVGRKVHVNGTMSGVRGQFKGYLMPLKKVLFTNGERGPGVHLKIECTNS